MLPATVGYFPEEIAQIVFLCFQYSSFQCISTLKPPTKFMLFIASGSVYQYDDDSFGLLIKQL